MNAPIVLCAAGQRITHVNYDKPGHPRSMHGDVTCDHSGAIRSRTRAWPRSAPGSRYRLAMPCSSGGCRQLGRAERTILRCLLDVWPGSLSRTELAEVSGYSATSSGFGNALGKLRTLELINRAPGIAADEAFAREVTEGASR